MASAKPTPDLPDDLKFALMKFRRNVADILIKKEEYDDYFLIRWLRARKWNTEAAEKMLRDSLKARQTWDVENLEKWNRPKVLDEYTPHGISGFDKEGSPIIIIPFAGMDMWGMLHCVTRIDFIKNTILVLERYSKIAYEKSLTYGPKARQFVVIFDMQDFFIKQYVWRPAAELVISLIKSYERNYPEILKMCYIINAPKIFSVAFNVVKKFLDEYTISKIEIHKQGSEKWLAKLLETTEPDQLPKHYGGTLTDEDGDPKCKSKICYGGRIPKDMYSKQDDDNNNLNTYEEAVINKASKLKIELESKEAGTLLKWEFRTFDHDIKFGIKSIDSRTGEKVEEIPLARVSSNEMDEIGFISCKKNTKYIVVFDNSGSYLRSKKIRYSVQLTTPIDDLEKNADTLIVEEAK